ncbi:hypothetical protein AO501_33835 [Mycobacterium gordonae]|uniref:Uncharacterized protein n=1 Tax=Mycobacterium gordonae TaxID=1778 RepID=A0A0Q2QD81_MYCGO|nr:DUF6636 domain-containing protein [Mycobacterium sp. TY813]KQH77661.1 hypothetical protein AO501_33835 [Mycobacterium gordonae]MDP7728809.1 hypothetical protein [Mycobacterium sp. TY813]
MKGPGVLACAGTALAVLTPATAHADGFDFFQTPSGNIACAMGLLDGSTLVDCEISDHTWAAPARPTPCMGAFGDRISMRQGSAPRLTCHSDTVRGTGYPVLQYGQSRSRNSVTCESEQSGITCTDSGTGHYFRFSGSNFPAIPTSCTDAQEQVTT